MIRTGRRSSAPPRRAGRSSPTPAHRVAATVALAAAVALAASACVGKTGRNDDDVAPGSGGGPSGNVVPHDG